MSALLRVLAAAGILAIPGSGAAQQEPQDSIQATRAGVYAAAQAVRGKSIYQLTCVTCHTQASHAGPEFVAKWEGRLLWDLYRYVSEAMPKSEPGSLAPEEYAGVIAYLLQMNGMPSGDADLPADSLALKKIRIEIVARRDSTHPR